MVQPSRGTIRSGDQDKGDRAVDNTMKPMCERPRKKFSCKRRRQRRERAKNEMDMKKLQKEE